MANNWVIVQYATQQIRLIQSISLGPQGEPENPTKNPRKSLQNGEKRRRRRIHERKQEIERDHLIEEAEGGHVVKEEGVLKEEV